MSEPFGHQMRKHFSFKEGWRNLNHGSFGTYPKSVRSFLRAFQDESEEAPDPFHREIQTGYINASRAELSNLLNAPISTLVMIPNVTTGINTVLRNIQWNSGDVILYFNTSYGACQNMIISVTETTPATSHRIPLHLPMSDDELLRLFKEAVEALREEGKFPRAALLDTIVSMPGVRLPYERLIEACKEEGILSIVDGAHGVGHVKLDLQNLDPDFFGSNCHKWLFTPRGSAFLYVPERNQHMIRTTFPTSHYFVPSSPTPTGHFNPLPPPSGNDTRFTKLFEFVGTNDNAPISAIPAALKFRSEVCGGEEKIMKYCSDITKEGALLIAKKLGTEILDNEEGTLTKECALINIRLPLIAPAEWASPNRPREEHSRPVDLGDGSPASVIYFIQKFATETFQTFIPILFYEGCWWARVSGQIYLEKEDFEYGANVLVEACERVKAGEHLKPAVGM